MGRAVSIVIGGHHRWWGVHLGGGQLQRTRVVLVKAAIESRGTAAQFQVGIVV